MGTSVCPFAKARDAYSLMLAQPMESPLATPLKHCVDKVDGGLVGLRDAFRLAASMCFMLGSLIWLLLECKYKGWPWRMMALDSPVEAVRKTCSDELYLQNDCCHDAGCTRKAKRLARDWPRLLNHTGVRSTIRMWKRKARFCNMNTERLLFKNNKVDTETRPCGTVVCEWLSCTSQRSAYCCRRQGRQQNHPEAAQAGRCAPKMF